MRLFWIVGAVIATALAQVDYDERGANKGAESCMGVKIPNKVQFKCKHKKKKGMNKMKRCRLMSSSCKKKKIFCNSKGWGSKGGKTYDINKLC